MINSTSEGVIAFANSRRSNGPDQLDAAGQSIVQLLHKAAGFAEANSRHALDMAQKLSHQLRAAEERIAELEAEAEAYRQRSERAEQWLHRVYTEIQDRFLQRTDGRRAN
jgi:molecular chaperone GrpE (heat shock protein)